MLVAYSEVAVVVDYKLESTIEPTVIREFTAVEELLDRAVISSLQIIFVIFLDISM